MKRLEMENILRRRISEFFTIALPEIAESLDSWINDNFQILKPAL
jgi:hypothetical protein